MPFNTTSSVIGADMNNTSTTALFALGTKISGTNNTEWTYCQSTAAFITGELVAIRSNGTAVSASTLILTSGAAIGGGAGAGGIEVGWAQGNWAALDFGWMCKRGDAVTVLMSGTAVPNTQLYAQYGQAIGCLGTTAASGTIMGVQLNASSSTSSLVLTTAVITWPRLCPGANPVG